MKQNLVNAKTFLGLAIVIMISLTSCNQYKKSPTGMPYKITKGKGKEKIKNGQFIKYNLEYRLAQKDTVLGSTYGSMPEYKFLDSSKTPKHSFFEIITQCTEGDKIEFNLNIDSLKSLGYIQAYDRLFKKGGTIKGKVDIIKVFKSEKEANEDYQKEALVAEKKQAEKASKETTENLKKNKGLLDEQTKALMAYTAKNNIKTVTSPLGVLVEVQNEGIGPKGENGKNVKLMYRGYLMDGKEFDANMGAKARSKEPLNFIVGNRSMMVGLEDAMMFFGKGGKGRVLVPAVLGYGAQEVPGLIPANSNVIFDIEVVDVLTAPTAPQQAPPPAPKN